MPPESLTIDTESPPIGEDDSEADDACDISYLPQRLKAATPNMSTTPPAIQGRYFSKLDWVVGDGTLCPAGIFAALAFGVAGELAACWEFVVPVTLLTTPSTDGAALTSVLT